MNWESVKSIIETKDIYAIDVLLETSEFWSLGGEIVIKAATKLRNLGFYDRALQLIQDIESEEVAFSPTQRLLLQYLRADLLLDSNNYTEAIEEYTQILLKDKSAVAYGNRGLAQWQCGEYRAALEDYKAAAALDVANPILLRGIGEMFLKLKQPNEAIPVLKAAISLNNNYAEAYTALGLARRDTDDWVKAYRCFKAALSLNPNDPVATRGVEGIEKWYGI